MKALSNISRIQLRNETLILLLDLYESKGKTVYYDDLFKRDLDVFLNRTLQKNVEEIVKLFKLDLTEARTNLCAKKNFVPKNKDEQLLLNIKTVIDRVQRHFSEFEIIPNEAEQLAKMIASNHTNISWRRVSVNDGGLLASNKTKSLREDLDKLIELYKKLIKQKEYELTNLITNFYVDFMNMKIFDNQNDLIALLFLYTMLFQHFPIFQYIPFFKYFRKNHNAWKLALEQANYNWDSRFPQTDSLTEILYRILVESYEEINEIAYTYEFEITLNKSDSLENTILKFNKLFSKEDLRKLHPTISDSTINRTLERLKDERKIMVIGAGRSSKWKVIVEQEKKISQMNMFD